MGGTTTINQLGSFNMISHPLCRLRQFLALNKCFITRSFLSFPENKHFLFKSQDEICQNIYAHIDRQSTYLKKVLHLNTKQRQKNKNKTKKQINKNRKGKKIFKNTKTKQQQQQQNTSFLTEHKTTNTKPPKVQIHLLPISQVTFSQSVSLIPSCKEAMRSGMVLVHQEKHIVPLRYS